MSTCSSLIHSLEHKDNILIIAKTDLSVYLVRAPTKECTVNKIKKNNATIVSSLLMVPKLMY